MQFIIDDGRLGRGVPHSLSQDGQPQSDETAGPLQGFTILRALSPISFPQAMSTPELLGRL